jgi:hypothetical protein
MMASRVGDALSGTPKVALVTGGERNGITGFLDRAGVAS